MTLIECAGGFDITIKKDGTWLYHGSPIGRKSLVKLFASVLIQDNSGAYWLQTPAEKGQITVEDAPFVGVALDVRGCADAQELFLHTNLDECVAIGKDHPLWVEMKGKEIHPYVRGPRGLPILVNRATYYALADIAVDHDGRPGVWSAGVFFEMEPVA